MKVRELRLGLESLMTMLSSWGPKTANLSELERFLQSLSRHDELSLGELSKQLEGIGGAPLPRGKGRLEEVDAEHVSKYIERFRSPDLDRLGYLALVSELQADKKMRVGELNALAYQIIKTEQKHKNKKGAIDAIQAWVQKKFDTQRRLGGTSELF